MSGQVRVSPFGVIFDATGIAQARFPDIRAQEEREHGSGEQAAAAVPKAAADTRDALLHLPAAGALLRELLPADGDAAAHGAIVEHVSTLLFHAYRYWREGRQLYRFEADAFERLLGDDDVPDNIDVPARAGYVQLPRNAVWARVTEHAAPEPVDGFFWSAPAHAPDTYMPRLDLLLALGVRAGRPGISTVDVAVAPADLTQWARASARPDGDDFANVLPGGELQGYHALTTRAEAIKLAALCFARIQAAGTLRDVKEDGDCVRTIHG